MKRDDMRASRGARTDESEEGAVPVSSSDDIRVHAVKQGPRYADVERVDVTEIPLQELKPARHGFPSFGVFYER